MSESGVDAYTEGPAPKSEQDRYNAAYIKGRRDMAAEIAAANRTTL